jgi:hypothetical protein
VDGGFLLHKVKWKTPSTYGEEAEQYVSYLLSNYGESSIVVFDGYDNGPSIKDHEHLRRNVKMSPEIVVEESKPAFRDQSAFLANSVNKRSLVLLLRDRMETSNFTVLEAVGDADTLIVETALRIAGMTGEV